MENKEKNPINPIDPLQVSDRPNTLAYPHHRGSAPVKPTKEGVVQSRALQQMEDQVEMQRSQLMDHIELIKSQLEDLNHRVDISHLIYQSRMGFHPTPSSIYHLYLKNDQTLLSMIGPEEWSLEDKAWLATVQLLSDHTWKILKCVENLETILIEHNKT